LKRNIYLRIIQSEVKELKMQIKIKFILIAFFIATVGMFDVKAQEALKPRISPSEIATVKYESTYVKVTYGRPHKNDRKIFGDLVPFGK
jgi:hypothetical protein